MIHNHTYTAVSRVRDVLVFISSYDASAARRRYEDTQLTANGQSWKLHWTQWHHCGWGQKESHRVHNKKHTAAAPAWITNQGALTRLCFLQSSGSASAEYFGVGWETVSIRASHHHLAKKFSHKDPFIGFSVSQFQQLYLLRYELRTGFLVDSSNLTFI